MDKTQIGVCVFFWTPFFPMLTPNRELQRLCSKSFFERTQAICSDRRDGEEKNHIEPLNLIEHVLFFISSMVMKRREKKKARNIDTVYVTNEKMCKQKRNVVQTQDNAMENAIKMKINRYGP